MQREMRTIQPTLDIIIVNYNSTGYLLQCLGSIRSALNGCTANIFVCDNGSTDHVDRITAESPQVRLVKNGANMGFAKAANRALEQITSPYVMLLNPDTYVMDDFFQTVLDYMVGNPKIGVLGPRILNYDGTVQGSARSFPTPLTSLFGRNSLMTRLFPNNSISRKNIVTDRAGDYEPITPDWISGACMVIRREAIEDVGLLDENFFMYWEDADWCRRMRMNGWKVVYLPKATVFHYVGASSNHAIFRSTLEFHKSAYRLYKKYNKSLLGISRLFVAAGLSLRFFVALAAHYVRSTSLKYFSITFNSGDSGRELRVPAMEP